MCPRLVQKLESKSVRKKKKIPVWLLKSKSVSKIFFVCSPGIPADNTKVNADQGWASYLRKREFYANARVSAALFLLDLSFLST